MNVSNLSSTFIQSDFNKDSEPTKLNVSKFTFAEAIDKQDKNPNGQVVVYGDESVVLQKDTVERLKEKFNDHLEYEGLTFLTGKSADLVKAWDTVVGEDLNVDFADKDGNGEISVAESLDVKEIITFDNNYKTELTTLRVMLKGDEEAIRKIEADSTLAFKKDDYIDFHLYSDENLDGKITEGEAKKRENLDIAEMRRAEKAYRENQGVGGLGGSGEEDLIEKLNKLEEKLGKLQLKLSKEDDPVQIEQLNVQIEVINQQIAVLRQLLMPS